MAITVSKGKTKEQATTKQKKEEVTELQLLIDEFANLDMKVKEIQASALFVKHDETKKQLLAALDVFHEPTEKGVERGVEFGVKYTGKRASNKVATVEAKKEIRTMVGDDVFYAIVDFPITKLRDYLTAPQFEKVVETEHTGARTVTGYKL